MSGARINFPNDVPDIPTTQEDVVIPTLDDFVPSIADDILDTVSDFITHTVYANDVVDTVSNTSSPLPDHSYVTEEHQPPHYSYSDISLDVLPPSPFALPDDYRPSSPPPSPDLLTPEERFVASFLLQDPLNLALDAMEMRRHLDVHVPIALQLNTNQSGSSDQLTQSDSLPDLIDMDSLL
jgi:hypothetical protein